jgi:hypothetical protein
MDQLPKLKDFKAIEAEPEPPEPFWKRAFAYIMICFICGCALGGYELYRSLGLSTRRQHYEVRNARPEDKAEIVKGRTVLWFAIGFGAPLVLLGLRELNRRNRNGA